MYLQIGQWQDGTPAAVEQEPVPGPFAAAWSSTEAYAEGRRAGRSVAGLEQLTLACSTLRGGQSCPPRDGGAALRGGQDCPPREDPHHSIVNC